jgi:hypothetical protein
MSFSPQDEINPFEAPRASIGAGTVDLGTDAEAELIRRVHLGHEASVQSIGSLYYLGAVGAAAGTIIFFLMAAGVLGGAGNTPEAGRVVGAIGGAVALALFALSAALGYGLTKLHTWARWTVVVLISLQLLNNLRQLGMVAMANPEALGLPVVFMPVAFSFLISGYILYLLVSPKGGVVFSPAYKRVIAKTPHIKYKTSLILKVFLVLVLGLITLAVVGAVMNGRR